MALEAETFIHREVPSRSTPRMSYDSTVVIFPNRGMLDSCNANSIDLTFLLINSPRGNTQQSAGWLKHGSTMESGETYYCTSEHSTTFFSTHITLYANLSIQEQIGNE